MKTRFNTFNTSSFESKQCAQRISTKDLQEYLKAFTSQSPIERVIAAKYILHSINSLQANIK